MGWFSFISRWFARSPKKEEPVAQQDCGCMFDKPSGKWYRSKLINGRCEPHGIPYGTQEECEALTDGSSGSSGMA